MKLFRKLRRNNKGLSLVELVCAVAIFGVATTAIGSAMVVSAQSYSRGTYELDVQQEAQTTTNLIGNLLVDAVNASFDDTSDPTNPKLVIDGEGVTCTITFDSANGTLKYEEKDSLGNISDGILAENVTAFDVDLSKYAKNRNAEVTLEIQKNGRSYDASYNTTSRNGTAENVGATLAADIQMETDVVLEPGQYYNFPINLIGMSVAEAGGLSKSSLTGSNVGGSTLSWNGSSCVTLFVADDAYDVMYFTISTNGEKKDADGNDTGEKLDTQTVTVKIRRVNSISVTHTLISGVDYMSGAVYRVDATAQGTNLSKKLGKSYDTDYVNPNYMDIGFSMEDSSGNSLAVLDYISVHTQQEEVDKPYIQFSLLQDMPVGSTIYVTYISRHANGKSIYDTGWFNKASVKAGSQDAYAYVSIDYPISRRQNGPWNTGDGIERGDKQKWYYSNGTVDTTALLAENNTANNYYKYMRFWEVGSAEPAEDVGWYLVSTTGTLDLQMQEKYSSIFEPDKAYVVELRLEVRDNSGTVVWPKSSTDRSEYVTRDIVSVAEVAFKCEALNINDFTTTVGSSSNPIELDTGTEYKFTLDLIGLKEESVGNDFQPVVLEYDSTQNKYVPASFNGDIDFWYDSLVYFKVKSQSTEAGKKICVLTTLDFKVSNTSTSDEGYLTLSEGSSVNYPIYDLSTGSGVLYFEFK